MFTEGPYAGLTKSTGHKLLNLNVLDKDKALELIKKGKLHPSNPECRGFGRSTYVEVCEWLGLPKPERANKLPKFCPHCGGGI